MFKDEHIYKPEEMLFLTSHQVNRNDIIISLRARAGKEYRAGND
jgi:hypothetical protein